MNNVPFRPMLAATLEGIDHLHHVHELMVSPKLDGIRCLMYNGQAVSRNLKPIPNRYIQEQLKGLPDGLDGELIVGPASGEGVFNRTTSGVMSHDGEPGFTYWVFDNFKHVAPFHQRYGTLYQSIQKCHLYVDLVPHWPAPSMAAVEKYEKQCVESGCEGIMIRRKTALYKQGRSTHNEGGLWKLKRFIDGEVTVSMVLEGQTNTNPASRDATGAIERSTDAAGMIPNGMVGTVVGTDLRTGAEVVMSAGRMTHDDRRRFWLSPGLIVGRVVKYKAFEYGAVDAPRFATFQGFRDPIDM